MTRGQLEAIARAFKVNHAEAVDKKKDFRLIEMLMIDVANNLGVYGAFNRTGFLRLCGHPDYQVKPVNKE